MKQKSIKFSVFGRAPDEGSGSGYALLVLAPKKNRGCGLFAAIPHAACKTLINADSVSNAVCVIAGLQHP